MFWVSFSWLFVYLILDKYYEPSSIVVVVVYIAAYFTIKSLFTSSIYLSLKDVERAANGGGKSLE